MTCLQLFFTALNHRLSNKNARKAAKPSSVPVFSTTPSVVIKEMKSQELPRDVDDADANNSQSTAFTEGYQLEDKIMSQRPLLLENPALDTETTALSTLRKHSVISKETQDQKERSGAEVYIQAAKPLAAHEAKNNTMSNLSTSPGLNHAVSTRLPFANSREPVTVTQMSPLKLKTRINPVNSSNQVSAIKDLRGSQFTSQNPRYQTSKTSSNKSIPLNHTSPFRSLLKPLRDESQTLVSSATLSQPIFKTPTLPTEVTLASKSPTLHYIDELQPVSSIKPIRELLEPQTDKRVSEPTIKSPQFQTEAPLSTFTLQSATSYHNFPVKKNPPQTEGQNRISQTPTSDTPNIYPRSQTFVQTKKLMTKAARWRQNQIPITMLPSASRSAQKLTFGEDFTLHMSQTIPETFSSTYGSIPSASPSILVSPRQLSAAVPVSSFSSRSSTSLATSSVQTFTSPPSKAQTAAKLPNLPTPSPVATPPHITSAPLPVPASSTWPPLTSSPAYALPISVSSSSIPPPKLSSSVTSSYGSLLSSFTIPPSSLYIDSASPSPFFSSSSISTSTSSSSISSQDSESSSSSSSESSPSPNFSETTSRHHRPSPVPNQSHNHHLTSTSPTLTSHLPTKKLLIHVTSLEPDPKPNVPTPGILHSPPKVHPNFDQNVKPNVDNKAKPNPAQIDNNLINPPSTPEIPVMDGKYPDIIPRNSTWVLGMLLGCSACLGMTAVVGLRYMYHQVCGKRTEVTLNDREREYGGGERGLIHVQECGDLVRVRRIRDNSFVFLAEYDILASAGD